MVVTDDAAALRAALAGRSGESANALEAQWPDIDLRPLQADVRDTLGRAYAAERSREPQMSDQAPEPDRSKPDRTPTRDRDRGL